VLQLLGSWPAPLAIFLRTPEGQMLTADARGLIAKGLGLLGSACVHLGEIEQAEEVFRIGIQYAQEGVAAADLFRRLGEALLQNERAGEAIGPLRRALAYGGASRDVMPPLARAFARRRKWVAAYACLRDALEAGVSERDLADELREVEKALGTPLTAWKARMVESKGS
jgi:tetratricopeptide (TPR) repeat protein